MSESSINSYTFTGGYTNWMRHVDKLHVGMFSKWINTARLMREETTKLTKRQCVRFTRHLLQGRAGTKQAHIREPGLLISIIWLRTNILYNPWSGEQIWELQWWITNQINGAETTSDVSVKMYLRNEREKLKFKTTNCNTLVQRAQV